MRCRVPFCTEQHSRHICRICKSINSHLTRFCPYNKKQEPILMLVHPHVQPHPHLPPVFIPAYMPAQLAQKKYICRICKAVNSHRTKKCPKQWIQVPAQVPVFAPIHKQNIPQPIFQAQNQLPLVPLVPLVPRVPHKKEKKITYKIGAGTCCRAFQFDKVYILFGREKKGNDDRKGRFGPFSGSWEYRDGIFRGKPNTFRTAKREFFEETGLRTSIVKFGSQRLPDFHVKKTPFWFAEIDIFDTSNLKATSEIDAFEFIDLDLLKRAFVDKTRKVKSYSGKDIEVSYYALNMACAYKNI
jgi:8-oxo-dGTP pyrophosphatase MutT (NUDIX family)